MTKLIITLSVAFVAVVQSLTAQVAAGIKGGVVSNSVEANLYIDAVNNAPEGYSSGLYGIFVEVPVLDHISIMTEVLRSRKGFTIDEGTSFDVIGINVPVGGHVTTSIDYIETPLLFKADIGSPTLQGYGIIGPSFGYATAARLQPTATLLINYNLPEVKIDLTSSMYNRWDVSAVVGLGGQLNIGQGRLFADVRYQVAMRDMVNSQAIEMDLKARNVQISAGYAYLF